MINLKIDGKDVQVAPTATILEAAEQVGIKIPTLCYLEKVSPTGACRLCVVEVEGAEKTMTACNTRAVDGMVVTTQSDRLAAIRRQVVELLLVNHPLDCPVCDAGGECDLQDVCYGLDVTSQPFEAEDVNAETIDRWPLIQQVPNRCIMCEKCVKVCHEVIGADALFINEVGDKAFIDKHLERCEFCGNCVQVCPTGTMISKPFKFKARPWELRKTASICTLCSAHCQADFHTKQNRLMRVTSEDRVTVNNGTLCIGGFFAHDYLHSDRRLTGPLVDQEPVSWTAALDKISRELSRIRDNEGGQALAGLTSGRLTNEEGYLFQKLFRTALQSNNIDSAARFGLLRAVKTLHSHLGVSTASNQLGQISRAEAILVLGSDLVAESPAVDWQVQEGHRKRDAKLVVADLRRVKLADQAETFLQYRPGSEVHLVSALAKLIVDRDLADNDFLRRFVANREELLAHLEEIDLAAACAATGLEQSLLEEAADYLGQAKSVAIVFGRDLMQCDSAESALAALVNLALVSGALHGSHSGLYPVEEQGNAFGLLDAGVCPELLPGLHPYEQGQAFAEAWHAQLPDHGLDASGILAGIEQGTVKALYLAGCNPLVDFPEGERWQQALAKLDLLVVQDILASDLTEMATVVLPGAAGPEKRGSMTASDGRMSTLRMAVSPPGEARPDLTIFADLYAALSGRTAPSEAAVRQEFISLSGIYSDVCQTAGAHSFCWKQAWSPDEGSLRATTAKPDQAPAEELQLLVGSHRFQFGTLTTFGEATNELAAEGLILVHPEDAQQLNVANQGARLKLTNSAGSITATVEVSERLQKGLLFAAGNFTDLRARRLATSQSHCVTVTATKA